MDTRDPRKRRIDSWIDRFLVEKLDKHAQESGTTRTKELEDAIREHLKISCVYEGESEPNYEI